MNLAEPSVPVPVSNGPVDNLGRTGLTTRALVWVGGLIGRSRPFHRPRADVCSNDQDGSERRGSGTSHHAEQAETGYD